LDNSKHDKSLKVKNKHRFMANVNESEEESDGSGGLNPGQLVVPSKSNAYRRTMEHNEGRVSPQKNDLRKVRKYKAGRWGFTTAFKQRMGRFRRDKVEARRGI
jgi:hypothetical protein